MDPASLAVISGNGRFRPYSLLMGRAQRNASAATAAETRRGRGRYTLLTPSGPQASESPGKLGGHRLQRIYGRLDCASALRAIAAGGPYPRHRVFFADEEEAIACGFRPCARCMPVEYRAWKISREQSSDMRLNHRELRAVCVQFADRQVQEIGRAHV